MGSELLLVGRELKFRTASEEPDVSEDKPTLILEDKRYVWSWNGR